MNKYIFRQSMILFMAAAVWGVAFVAQSVGMDYVGPFTFIAVRNVVALAVLVPCAMAYAVAYVFLPRVPCSSLA